MSLRIYEIPGIPTPWASHKGYGRKSFNPRFKEKQAAQWHLKIQHDNRPLYNRAIRVDFFYQLPFPKSTPKKVIKRFEAGETIWHDKRPDRSNFTKFIEDCCTGAIWTDDCLVVAGEAQKYYSDKPKTIIHVQEIA